jgi:hypothetical protein
MNIIRILCLTTAVGMSGCVFGYGHCLFLKPVKVSLAGKVHFRDFPAADGIDNVPILALTRTEYIYDPAPSHLCLPVNEVQMVGLSQFPADVIEGTPVSAAGALFEASMPRQHTRFVLDVTSLLPKP